MDYFATLFKPPLKCCYVELRGDTHVDTPLLSSLALPLHIGWCSRQASWGALPFPSQEHVLDVDGAAETFPPGSSWLLFAGVNFSSRLSEKVEARC